MKPLISVGLFILHLLREGWIIIKIFEWKVFLHDYLR